MRRSDLGERLYGRRTALGLTRRDVASAAGIHPEYLRYLEEQPGWPTQETLLRLAHALSVPLEVLLGYTERVPAQPYPEPDSPARRPQLVPG